MPALRNQRHELYAKGIARGLTSDAAYVEAGYKRNRDNASTLKAKQNVRERISELEQETHKAVVQHFIITKQYLVDAIIENIEIALGRHPVKIGADGVPAYTYRGEAANTAIKMAAIEVGLFKDKAEVTHRMDFSDLSDDELLRRLRDETDALIRERAERAARRAADNGEALLLERQGAG
jgi:hypothetical protein